MKNYHAHKQRDLDKKILLYHPYIHDENACRIIRDNNCVVRETKLKIIYYYHRVIVIISIYRSSPLG